MNAPTIAAQSSASPDRDTLDGVGAVVGVEAGHATVAEKTHSPTAMKINHIRCQTYSRVP